VADAPATCSHRPHIIDGGRWTIVVRTDPAVVTPSGGDLPRIGTTATALGLAVVAIAVLWTGVATGTLLAALDPAVDGWIVTVRPPALVATAAVISTVGQPVVMIAVLVVVVAALGWRSRSWGPAAVGAGAVVMLGVLDNGVKAVVARPRPPVAWQAVPAHGLAFPSGHALWSAGVLLLVVVLVGPFRGRVPLTLVALVIAVGVAGSRLVLAVHYPSDVLAGWSLAVLADGIVLLVAAGAARRRGPRLPAS
jgi:membrane-associated phospholipid phosphatase